jgi:glucuronokinase
MGWPRQDNTTTQQGTRLNRNKITARGYARAGLLGNPSDGYHGKTISMLLKDYWAEVCLIPSDRIALSQAPEDNPTFQSVTELADHVQRNGYYGGLRLIKAAIYQLHNFCRQTGQPLDRNFAISYTSNIPRGVGLAGSSAIVVAALRALIEWYGAEVPIYLLPSLALHAETALGIPAGLQDRVIQSYGGVVFMDFSRPTMKQAHGLEYGVYTRLDPQTLPPLYIAFTTAVPQPTEIPHSDLRARYQNGEREVAVAMSELAALAEAGRICLVDRRLEDLATLIDRNFDLRHRICELHPEHVRMVELARNVGASAKFCGSGGAIVGTYTDEAMFDELAMVLRNHHCHVFRPEIAIDPAI